MSRKDIDLDRYYARFNPDDLSAWLDRSPAAFIFAAVHDLGTFISLMHGWAALWVDEIGLEEVKLPPPLNQLLEQMVVTLDAINQISHTTITEYTASRSHEEFESQPALSTGLGDGYVPERAALEQLQAIRPHCVRLRTLANAAKTATDLSAFRLPGSGGAEMSLFYLVDLMLVYTPPIERILDTASVYCRKWNPPSP